MRIENEILTVGAVSMTLPELSTDAVVHAWQVPAEYRDNGLFVAVNMQGQPMEIPACAPEQATYLGQLDYPASEAEQLQAAKLQKLAGASAACDAALAQLSQSYPAGEIQSWPQQVKEADAFAVDPDSPTPLLSAIAASRGLELLDLVGRVHAMAEAYAELSGGLIGHRQAIEDQIDAANTLAELEAIAW